MIARLVMASVVLISPSGAAEEPEHLDPRSHSLLAYECATEIGRRDVTLFGNGTLRQRERNEESERMYLAELERDELEAFIRRLSAEDLSEAESKRYGPVGDWVEQCTLALDLPRSDPARFRFAHFDSLELHLRRVVQIAEELGRLAVERDTDSRLPFGYEPERGDVLIRADGARFEVVGLTGDGTGVELRGIDHPLTLYLLEEALGESFVALESRLRPLR